MRSVSGVSELVTGARDDGIDRLDLSVVARCDDRDVASDS